MLDFNNEEQQRVRAYGPVPAGSRVLLRMELMKPQFADTDHAYVQLALSGLRGLWVEFTVLSGTYEGVKWRENVWLPKGMQNVSLSEGQAKGCNMWGARLKAILESASGISPKDDSPKASRARQTQDWLDFHGVEFPAAVGISNKPYTGKDGNTYWNNALSRIVTADDKDYRALMDGAEIITDGPVVGKGDTAQRSEPEASTGDVPPWGDIPPPDDSDIPF